MTKTKPPLDPDPPTQGLTLTLDLQSDPDELSALLLSPETLTEETATRALHIGFIRCHDLVAAMVDCPGWQEALPLIYQHLSCPLLPGAPPDIEGWESYQIWTWVFRAMMANPAIDWVNKDPSSIPPLLLQPYKYDNRKYIPTDPGSEHEFVHQYVNLAEFKEYIEGITRVMKLPLPLPPSLFPSEAADKSGSRGALQCDDKAEQSAPVSNTPLPFPCPDAKWEDITITLVPSKREGHEPMVRVKTPLGQRLCTYHQLGFARKSSGDKPINIWVILKLFCKGGGEIDSSSIHGYSPQLVKNVSRLNSKLQELFGIHESFLPHYKKTRGYKSRINFRDETFDQYAYAHRPKPDKTST